MDYLKMIDSVQGVACIVSVRKGADDAAITIVAANKRYLASVNKLDEEFVPGRPYSYYIAQDPNFDALARGCVTTHKIAHQYVNAELYNSWLDLYMIPLEDDDDGNGYCLFTYEMNPKSDSEKMVDISAATAFSVLKTCIKFRENEDFKTTLDSIVKDIRKQCESDGCALILTDTVKRKIDLLSFDSQNIYAPVDEDVFFKPEFYNIVETWHDFMAGSNCIIISNEKELKSIEEKSPDWYKSLTYSGVKTMVLYPLRIKDNLYGYIFATNFNADKTPFIREVMELNSYVLSAETENYRMRQQLEMLSKTDLLTGVLNRNAMNNRVYALAADEEARGCGVGAIFVDVNGLKTVNDTKGHQEGDKLIMKVAANVGAICKGKEVYRAGGDEFVVIAADTTGEEFNSMFDKLKSISNVEGGPSFALGGCYQDKDINMRKIMKAADANMYKDKAEYYKAHPDAEQRKK
ncbi:MAG: GGDEF domain-containing protein [Lachnospiraceae bacterium]|nr:GGDEF domain-containing protein [Lachnospiraceae bacterium]